MLLLLLFDFPLFRLLFHLRHTVLILQECLAVLFGFIPRRSCIASSRLSVAVFTDSSMRLSTSFSMPENQGMPLAAFLGVCPILRDLPATG